MKAFTYRLQAKTSKPLLVNIQTSGAFFIGSSWLQMPSLRFMAALIYVTAIEFHPNT
jgi:hypothetical protein